MPTFKITNPDTGQVIRMTGESAPSEQDIQQAFSQIPQLKQKAGKEDFISPQERLSGGFRSPADLETRREQQRAERGLAPGTPLEPTGFNLENLLDFPADVLDAIGPAFPAVGQILGGVLGGAASVPSTGGSTLPAAVAAGGVGGAVTGEAVRQAIGDFLGFDQGSVGERAGRLALEGALSTGGEVASLGLNTLLRNTKKGILKAVTNLSKKQGFETFVKHTQRIFRNTKPEMVDDAISLLRKGDGSVLNPDFAKTNFLNEFSQKFLFGNTDDVAQNIKRLTSKPISREPLRQTFQFLTGISDEAFEVATRKGDILSKATSEKEVLGLARKISEVLDKSFKTIGRELGQARIDLATKAKVVDVSDALQAANLELADNLTRSGFLINEGNGAFSINTSFAVTPTGRSQRALFSEMITRFFGKAKNFTSAQENALKKAIIEGNEDIIKKITRGKMFSVNNPMAFGKFSDALKIIDVQISGNEFKTLDRLSPAMAGYLKNLRGITLSVAEQIGDTRVPRLTSAFSELARTATPLRQGSKIRDVGQVESILKRYANPKAAEAATDEGLALNDLLKRTLNIDFLDNLKTFNAAQEISKINSVKGKIASKTKLASLMKTAFTEESGQIALQDITQVVDGVLPETLKIGLNAKRHAIATALNKDALSILRARFASTALFAPVLGAASGGTIGGIEGATAGLGIGFMVQSPQLAKALVKLAAKKGKIPAGLSKSTPQFNRAVPVGTSELLRQLIGN